MVPAFDEAADCIDTLTQNLSFERTSKSLLIILVLNAPADATDAAITRTQAGLPDSASIAPEEAQPGIQILRVDAVTEPLPADHATGLARKIGNDIACQLIARGHITTPVLCNTDADAILPADYFSRISRAHAESNGPHTRSVARRATDTAAWVLPFEHVSDDLKQQQAGTAYELYLRSLQLNLQRCGSPYAYPALGSLLAINPVYYAKSRGFPKRRAGEDFYLLNKLAKLAGITYLTGVPVRLAARLSSRVPFGTGPAIAKMLQEKQTDKEQKPALPCDRQETYALASFALLRQFYAGISELQATEQTPDKAPPSKEPLNQERAARKLPKAWQDPDLLWLLKHLGVPGALVRLKKNYRTDSSLHRAVHEWFDALKTVRFLNEARHFHDDEPLMSQIEHLRTFLPQGYSSGDYANAAPEPTPEERWQRVCTINRDLELNRSITRHSVIRSGDDSPTN